MEKIIYGSELAKDIKKDIKQQVTLLKDANQRIPHLVVLFVGNDVGSTSYVSGKGKDCLEVGILNTTIRYDETISEKDLLAKIEELNNDSSVDGILVQLPLPKHIDANKVLFAIDPNKDVDGFHPFNVGKMLINEDTFLPCTAKGVVVMLEAMGYQDLSGMKAVVVGRSNIVGKPLGQLLLCKNATVTMTHSKTKDLPSELRQADIVIAAVGISKFIQADWIKEGAIVIDVGVNRDENNKLSGDVDFENILEKAQYITPVPRGVGPMTRAMLLVNTIESYTKREKK